MIDLSKKYRFVGSKKPVEPFVSGTGMATINCEVGFGLMHIDEELRLHQFPSLGPVIEVNPDPTFIYLPIRKDDSNKLYFAERQVHEHSAIDVAKCFNYQAVIKIGLDDDGNGTIETVWKAGQ